MRYLVVAWSAGQSEANALALCERIASAGAWRAIADFDAAKVFSCGRPFPVRALGSGVVLGSLRGSMTPRPLGVGLSAKAQARDLAQHAWGRYVAVLRDPAGRSSIFNDPLGGQECLVWQLDGATLVSSEIPVEPCLRPPGLAIDWTVLAQHLPNLSLAPDQAPLTELVSVGPGCLYEPHDRARSRLWSPAQIVEQAQPGDFAAKALRRTVDDTVAALAADRKNIVCDVSGGLDSAIVAAALKACAPFSAVHQRFVEPEADESGLAKQVAARLGVPLKVIDRSPITWTAPMIEATADGPRPSTNAIDGVFDQVLADHLEATGADALFTGHGGDAVFYQSPNAGLFLEALRNGGVRSRLTAAGNVAFRLKRSYLKLLCDALRPSEDLLGAQRPAWLEEARALSAARQVQVMTINYARHRFGRSVRERYADLVDPLVAQPVVEWCLRAPIMSLTGGDIDRTLAREAYRDALPERITQRARKGDVSVFFAKSLLNSRAFLRDYLLGGRMREQGLIDAQAVEAALDPHTLLWRGVMEDLLPPLAAEAWVRVTERRLGATPRQ